MDEGTQKVLNVTVNVAMAIVLLVAVIYAGIYGGKFIKSKLSQNSGPDESKRIDESAKQAKSIWGVGLVFFVLLSVLFLLSKITKKSSGSL